MTGSIKTQYKLYTFVLIFCYLLASNASANLLLPPVQSQTVSVYPSLVDNKLELIWDIPSSLALYKDKIQVIDASNGQKLTDSILLPPPESIIDFEGNSIQVYKDTITTNLDISHISGDLILIYQACSLSDELCYLPKQRRVIIDKDNNKAEISLIDVNGNLKQENLNSGQNLTPSNKSLQDNLYDILAQAAIFLLLGISISFTPCVLPVLPLIYHSIKIHGGRHTPLAIASAYVVGMAIAYALLGLSIGIIDTNIQVHMQRPAVIYVFAAILTTLAAIELDCLKIPVPRKFNQAIEHYRNKQGHGILPTMLMGLLSILIVSPCTTPAIASLMLAVAHLEVTTLASTVWFLSFGVGSGLPLIAIALYGDRILPKTGPWMITVKYIFGCIILGLATWLITRILSPLAAQVIWGVFATSIAVIAIYHKLPKTSSVIKSIVYIAFAIGLTLISLGVAGKNIVYPANTAFTTIRKITVLNELTKIAKNSNQPTLIKVDAKWCSYCKKLDKEFFNTVSAIDYFSENNYMLIKADVTDNFDLYKSLRLQYSVHAIPTIIILDKKGMILTKLYGTIPTHDLWNAIHNYK